MEVEELWKYVEAYEKLLEAVRSCSTETQEEVLEEIDTDNNSIQL